MAKIIVVASRQYSQVWRVGWPIALMGILIGHVHLQADASELESKWPVEEATSHLATVTWPTETVELRFTSEVSEASPLVAVWQEGVEFLRHISGGAIEIRLLHGGKVHNFRNSFSALRAGNTDLSNCASLMHPASFSLALVWYLPFVAGEKAHVNTRVALAVAAEYIKPEFERQAVYFGHQAVSTPIYIMSTQPVRRLEDIQDLKIGAFGIQHDLIYTLGATPVGIPIAETYLAMQRGVVDAIMLPDTSLLAYNLPEIAKFRTKVPLGAISVDHCVSKSSFDGLPPSAQKALYAYQQILAIAESAALSGMDQDMDAAFAEAGVENIELSAAEIQRWKTQTKPFVDRWIAEAESRNRPALELLAQIPSLYKKYEGMTHAEVMRAVALSPVPDLIDGF